MSGLFNQFKTSKIAEIEGIEVRFKPNDDGTIPCFRIARMSKGNVRYTKSIEARTRSHRKDILDKSLTNEAAEEINLNVFCDSILLGWENVIGEDGKIMLYTWESAKKLMQELPDLYDLLKEKAEDIDNFLSSNLEAEAKN